MYSYFMLLQLKYNNERTFSYFKNLWTDFDVKSKFLCVMATLFNVKKM